MIVFFHALSMRHQHPAFPAMPGRLGSQISDWFNSADVAGFGNLIWVEILHRPTGTIESDEVLAFLREGLVSAEDVPDHGMLYLNLV